MSLRLAAMVSAVCLLPVAPAHPLERIYLVRHAEKLEAWLPGADLDAFRPLSPEGVRRAEGLAGTLSGAGIAAIYASPTTRALETALPLAARSGARVVAEAATADPSGMRAFLDGLRTAHARDRAVLIVGHSNTIPALLEELGATPDCYRRLGIVATGEGPRIEGHDDLWEVDLAATGCGRISRRGSAHAAVPEDGVAKLAASIDRLVPMVEAEVKDRVRDREVERIQLVVAILGIRYRKVDQLEAEGRRMEREEEGLQENVSRMKAQLELLGNEARDGEGEAATQVRLEITRIETFIKLEEERARKLGEQRALVQAEAVDERRRLARLEAILDDWAEEME